MGELPAFSSPFHHRKKAVPDAGNEKVFEVPAAGKGKGGGGNYFLTLHFLPRPFDTIEVVPVAGPLSFWSSFGSPDSSCFRFISSLREKRVVRKSESTARQLRCSFVHHAIVVGIVLKSAHRRSIRAGDAEAVELTEEEPGGIKLIFAGELWVPWARVE